MDPETSKQEQEQDLPIPDKWKEIRSVVAIAQSIASTLDRFIGDSTAAQDIRLKARVLACYNHPVLITGPTGTGKEIIAQSLKWKILAPFVSINVAALPDTLLGSLLFGHVKGSFTGANEDRQGAFVAAGDGTIFLDEIGDMPLSQQAYLLRVLQEKIVTPIGAPEMEIAVNCRVIAATNKDLQHEIALGRFREDLYARLFTFEIKIPPLIPDREADIPAIAASLNIPTQYTVEKILTNPRHRSGIEKWNVRYLQKLAAEYSIFGECLTC